MQRIHRRRALPLALLAIQFVASMAFGSVDAGLTPAVADDAPAGVTPASKRETIAEPHVAAGPRAFSMSRATSVPSPERFLLPPLLGSGLIPPNPSSSERLTLPTYLRLFLSATPHSDRDPPR